MIYFPNAKINLGLNITEKRSDGFHNIETVFYPINWCDTLEATENKNYQAGKEKLNLTITGVSIDGNARDNIIHKAYNLLDAKYNLPPIIAHLHKVILMGAGLGGGSADGAFFIKLLNEKFNLNLSVDEQVSYAKQLGSDCAFFIKNKPVFATGKGDVFTEIKIDLSPYCILVVYPAIHSNTVLAYKEIVPAKPTHNIQNILSSEIKTWKNELTNDFEKNIFLRYPELRNIKDALYNKGAIYASMSGSGSAMYGIFEKNSNVNEVIFPANYLTWKSTSFLAHIYRI
ncbi:MAG: 4-(cytidine 5'-diphospho)-2-C-methyl-D-erythritol kinase [Bacteroidia bacterium]